MKRRLFALLFVGCCLFLPAGCANGSGAAGGGLNEALPDTITVAGKTYTDLTPLEATVAASDFAVAGVYQDMEEYEDYVYYRFTVKEVLYGGYSEDTLYVYRLNESEPADMRSAYQKGKTYLLLLSEGIQAEENEHPHYLSVRSGISFPQNGPYTLYGEEIAPPEGERMADYLISLADRFQVGSDTGTQCVLLTTA